MADLTLEERVAIVEADVEKLKQQKPPDKSGDTVVWWKKFVGVFEGNPEFDEDVRLGREWRDSANKAIIDTVKPFEEIRTIARSIRLEEVNSLQFYGNWEKFGNKFNYTFR